MRRILRLGLQGLAGLVGLLLLGLLAIGWKAEPADVPPGPVALHTPGEGGLRRPFPRPRVRADNPSTPAKVALGRLLFFDPILSGANDLSCATCHHPDLGLADGRGLAMGRGGKGIGPERRDGAGVRRGTPTLWNALYAQRLFWDGRADDLEDQARFPITSAMEMDQRPEELVRELAGVPEYVRLFDGAFGARAGAAVTFDNTLGAIAAFERTLVSDRSRFDRYAAGELDALSPPERRGLTLFRSLKTRCFECHGFPTFANPDFKVIGVPDLSGHAPDLGRAETGAGPAYARAFKVPTLRNVAVTAPYMHNGRFATLEEVLDFYAKGGGAGLGQKPPNLDDKIRPFTLTPRERADLIAFLHALTDESRLPAIPERVPSGLPVVSALRAAPPRTAAPAASPAAAAARPPAVRRVSAGGSIQAAIDAARPGDTIEVGPGAYHETLLVDRDRITLRGLARNGARPVLDGRARLSDAVIASGHALVIEGFVIRRYTGNGITVHGATGVELRDLELDDTGLYGVYPVECRNVLVERVSVRGARDAGIYLGQSRDVVVRRNRAFENVTGIEIENTVHALVEDNDVHDNTGGILVFLLPNNPSKLGSDTRVAGNRVIRNNHPNFGDPAAIVSKVPAGSGIFVMGADRTEVTGNQIRSNDSFGVAVVGLGIAFPKGTLFDVGVVPQGNRVHGNVFENNGRNPAPSVRAAGGGADLIWDGSGSDNVWHEPGATRFPRVLPGERWPGLVRRAYARLVAFAAERIG